MKHTCNWLRKQIRTRSPRIKTTAQNTVLRSIPHYVSVKKQLFSLTICRYRDKAHACPTHSDRQSCLLLKCPAPESPRGTLTKAPATHPTPTSQRPAATQLGRDSRGLTGAKLELKPLLFIRSKT